MNGREWDNVVEDQKSLDKPETFIDNDKQMITLPKQEIIDILKALDGAKKKLQERIK
jgi:hypothetical protein